MAVDILMLCLQHKIDDLRVYQREAHALAKKYTLLILGRPSHISVEPEKNITLKTIKPSGIPLIGGILLSLKTIRVVLAARPKVIHVHELRSLPVAILSAVLTRAQLVYDVHEFWEKSHFAGKLPPLLRKMIMPAESILAGFAGYVITVNHYMEERFQNHSREGKLLVLPNYPNTDAVQFPRAKPAEQETVFVYAGGLSEDRGIYNILNASKELVCRGEKRFKVLLAGRFASKEIRETFLAKVKECELEDHIHYLGLLSFQEVLEKVYAQGQVGLFLCHSKVSKMDYGEPIKYFEYAASGLPVIISDLPAKRKLVETGKNGILVDPLDHNAVADSMHTLMEDRQRWETLSENGLLMVDQHWCWGRLEEKLLAFYRTIIE